MTSSAQIRTRLRWLHLVASVLIGTYVYSPWTTTTVEWFRIAVQYFVIPVTALSGLWMWKGASWRRRLTGGTQSKHPKHHYDNEPIF